MGVDTLRGQIRELVYMNTYAAEDGREWLNQYQMTDRIIELVREALLNGVYRERNQVVAALSKVFPAWVGPVDDQEPGWTSAVYIDLPTGQVSWHIPDHEVQELFGHLSVDGGTPWDGHTTEEKYARLAALGEEPPLESEKVARLRAQVGRLQAAARKAHDAMTNWHFVHGEPGALMSPEEAEMGEACKTIAALLDEGDDDR